MKVELLNTYYVYIALSILGMSLFITLLAAIALIYIGTKAAKENNNLHDYED